MPKVKAANSQEPIRKMRPALSEEARENQLISLATDLVEKRLREGTATSQETTHFLKLGSRQAKLELEIRELEKELVKAKTENIKSQQRLEETYAKALEAMKLYGGKDDDDDY